MDLYDRLELIGLIVALASLLCSVANAAIRAAVEHGYNVPRWLRVAAAAANAVALNLDQVPRIGRYRGRDGGLP
jgi:hypothetical protein